MRFEISAAVGQHGVGGGVGFAETVPRELRDHLESLFRDLPGHSSPRRLLDEALPHEIEIAVGAILGNGAP